jgi:type II secretory pathway pseudopilin PulG
VPASTRPFDRSRCRRSAYGRCLGLRREEGFTLLETLIAAVVLVVGLTMLFGLLDTSLKTTASTRAREGATNLARQIIEDVRSIPYARLAPGAVVAELQAMTGLADESAAAGWQVVQRGITYTVTASECAVDDPKDGFGKHENSFKENPFCGDSTITTPEKDTQPEDLKRITVDVAWTARGRNPSVHQVETLTAAGVAPGLTASGLRLETPVIVPATIPVVIETEPATKTLTFAVSAPSSTAAMRWSLEGVAQSVAPVKSSGTTWTFSWSIPYPELSDGTYTVSAQAIDATGVVGPAVSIPVTLARGTPAAVSGLKGGFNTINLAGVPTKVVELQWKANAERNVIGYRVYNPSSQLVCPENLVTLSVAITCIDTAPPLPNAANLTYAASALYRNAKGELKEGPAGSFTVVGGPPAAPNPPTGLTLTKNADGSVTLKWAVPVGGPAIVFYRIYRESTNKTGRYDVTPSGASTSYTDTDAVVSHSYWITAVDANLTESSFVGPVTG